MNEQQGNNDNRQEPRSYTAMPGINIGFLALVFVMGASGYVLYNGMAAPGLSAFLFVLSGWLIALCLHEFGHALTAYRGGDSDIASSGYLTLNPFSYTHPVYSLLLPSLFIIMGFMALPGGAVYVRTSALRSHYWESAVSAAGPFATLLCLCVICAPFSLGWYNDGGAREFWGAMAILASFIALALVWNLLPVPGLDGWGIIEPYLGRDIQTITLKWRQAGPMLLVAAVIIVRPIGDFIFGIAWRIAAHFDVPASYIGLGLRLFSFWR